MDARLQPVRMMQAFDYKTIYATPRRPVFARNIVSCSHPLAAQAGLRMIAAGGNAVDAAVAAAAVMTLVEPVQQRPRLGFVLHPLGRPARCTGSMRRARRPRCGRRNTSTRSSRRAARRRRPVAGARSPCRVRWLRGSAMSRALRQVAVRRSAGAGNRHRRARLRGAGGHSAQVAACIRSEGLVSQPGFAEVFLPRGRVPEVGELMRMPGAASALRAIASTRGEAFYRGEIAQAIERQAKAQGGALRAADLAGFRAAMGRADRAWTTAATGCTRSRPTGRASRR